MSALSPPLRRQLERAVLAARTAAETGARKALGALGVDQDKPPRHLTSTQVELHRRLRAQAHMLGDGKDLKHLIEKIAYDHWHRLLFSRFLLENHMLLHPEHRVPLEFQDIADLAIEAGVGEPWDLATRYTASILPGIFRPDDPIGDISLPSEDRGEVLRLLKELPTEVFQADDSLGWVYQFWRAAEKDAVNKAGDKIDADTLPAVTQLFTEHYMVEFLLHNTLGAWWAAKHRAKLKGMKSEAECRMAIALPGVNWEYLRFIKDENTGEWQPAAGTFDGWPKIAKELRLLDPCMGSGHFVVAELPILVAMRISEERLATEDAVAAVLRDNLFGLEIDSRCTQIAAFNLALAAWKLGGYQALPPLNLACSGLGVNAREADWLKIARDSEKLQRGMQRLYQLFRQAPVLGSLIDPRALGGDLLVAEFHQLQPLLEEALQREKADDAHEMAVTAQGVAKAAEILAGQFTLVGTNVPYLGIRKQCEPLKDFATTYFFDAKEDLATVFCARISRWLNGTTMAVVTPQNWFYQFRYRHHRRRVLEEESILLIARLGEGGFESPQAAGAFAALSIITCSKPSDSSLIRVVDASEQQTPREKAAILEAGEIKQVEQNSQLSNPDARLSFEPPNSGQLLNQFVITAQGIKTGDDPFWVRCFWEMPTLGSKWRCYQTSSETSKPYAARSWIINWETNGDGMVRPRTDSPVVGKIGVVASAMREISVTLYTGDLHYSLATPLVPLNPDHLPAIWAFCSSPEYNKAIRDIEQNIAVTTDTLAKVPFDLAHWQKVGAEKYPNGLAKPFSSDPTQWLFNGHPNGSDQPLQVAVARLLGYRWPRQTGSAFPDCPALEFDGLEGYVDEDGIVCINAIKGESPAAERLRDVLGASFGGDWSAQKLSELLASSARSLDDWLRNHFFYEHCAMFHQRPFLWQIWDGRKDGFSAIVNYHRLDRSTLEKLTYAYLGDWLRRQQAAKEGGEAGSDARHQAAVELQTKLKLIIEGEPPYDIFVRWKPLEKQPLGWEPDLNDGVRLNIRPFVTADILRKRPNINWRKDRGKDVTSAPWYDLFRGERINDHHLTLEEKRAARLQADTSSVGDAAAVVH